jgi:hypothetical protein
MDMYYNSRPASRVHEQRKERLETTDNLPCLSDRFLGTPFVMYRTPNSSISGLVKSPPLQIGLILKCNAIKENTSAFRSWTR